MKPIINNIMDFLFAAIPVAATLYFTVYILATLKRIIRATRNKASKEIPNHQVLLLSIGGSKVLRSIIYKLQKEFKEFSAKVRYDHEKIYDQRAEKKFKEVCHTISGEIETSKEHFLSSSLYEYSSLYESLDEINDFLKKSADSKEPVAKVSLNYKLHRPVGRPFEGEVWEGEVIDKKKYWKDKIWLFPIKEGTHNLLGIEVTYTKKLLEAPIATKKFKECLENKIKQVQEELKEARIMMDDQQERGDMNKIIDRILHNTPANGDMEALRQWLQSSEGQQFAQQVTQPTPPPPADGNRSINIGQITGGEIQFGNRYINGTDAETLKNLVSSLVKELQAPDNAPTPTVAIRKILVLAASPEDQVRLNLEKEVKEIDLALRLGSHREQFTLDQRWGASRRDLQDILLTIKPDIVHFCGHGASEHGLVLQNDNRKAQLVPNAALAELFEIISYSKPIACLVLNACYSEVQVNAISPFIDYIVGMKKEIGDKAAIEFSRGFYRSLSDGLPYNIAFRFGKNAIALDAIPEDLTPVLKGKAVPQ